MAFWNIALYLSYILIAVCTVAAIVLPLIKAFGDPNSLKNIGMGVGALAVIFIISYFLADNSAYEKASSGTSQVVGAGLITMYIFAAIAVVGIVITEIKKAFS